jgi:alanine racemase
MVARAATIFRKALLRTLLGLPFRHFSRRKESLLNWVEIDAAALRHNLQGFRRAVGPRVVLGAVVKSNAYGHGMLETARIAVDAGADWLCVSNLDEALALRRAGHGKEILVMGYVPLDGLEDVVRHELRPVVYNLETVERLDALGKKLDIQVPLHLKIETGTHRQGILESDVAVFAERIRDAENLTLEGLSTHFANIEDTTNHEYAEKQIEVFDRVTEAFRDAGCAAKLRHSACSAAALLFARTHLDLARLGIAMYGLWPSKETYLSCVERGNTAVDLRPALTWKTRIAQVKDVAEGAWVGYGCTWKSTRPSRIAVLPVGYAEGYDRGLSGVAHVLIGGRRAPIRGRICMNICLADVTDIPAASLEDEVVLLGSQGGETITAEQLATWAGTISYEIVARIHPGLPRVVLEQEA